MPRLTIDGRTVDVPEGATILEAAAELGIALPTLCHARGETPDPSCFVCVVQVEGRRELTPSCAAPADEGLVVHTNTDDVLAARRASLELLLSDHAGDCVAPCTRACPARLDVADFVHAITAGDYRRAIAIIKRTIPLPASLGRVCPAFCEKVCRRAQLDESVAIRALRRFVADWDLAAVERYVPERAEVTGKRIAIVGAGPAGLSAAFYLLQQGHAVVMFEAREEPGGMFRYGIADWRLPNDVLDGEIDVVRRLGLELRTGVRLGDDVTLDALQGEFDAVLLAIGAQVDATSYESHDPASAAKDRDADLAFLASMGLETARRGAAVDRHSQATSREGVFAAGTVTGGPNYGVHAVGAGRRAALAIDQFVRGQPVVGEPALINSVLRDLDEDELARLHDGADPSLRVLRPPPDSDDVPEGLSESEARTEARRCLDCDCAARRDCLLRLRASEAGASAAHYRGARRPFERDTSHSDIVYESGKCIQCGRCLRVAEAHREALGLTFVGRGFSVRTATPLGSALEGGLRRAALQCAEACPTGAISLRRHLRKER